jgi:hypothetical protein
MRGGVLEPLNFFPVLTQQPVCANHDRRAQEPTENGTADISVVMSVEITQEEQAGIKLDEREYDEFQWIEPARIVSERSSEPTAYEGGFRFHPALRQSVSDWLALREWGSLAESAADDRSDAHDLGRRFREFVLRCARPRIVGRASSGAERRHISQSSCSSRLEAMISKAMGAEANPGALSVALVASSLASRVFSSRTYEMTAEGLQRHVSVMCSTGAAEQMTSRNAWLLGRVLWATEVRQAPQSRRRDVEKLIPQVASVCRRTLGADATPFDCWATGYLLSSSVREDNADLLPRLLEASLGLLQSATTPEGRCDAMWAIAMAFQACKSTADIERLLSPFGDAGGLARRLRKDIPWSDFRGW